MGHLELLATVRSFARRFDRVQNLQRGDYVDTREAGLQITHADLQCTHRRTASLGQLRKRTSERRSAHFKH